jgi:hypothetical protein
MCVHKISLLDLLLDLWLCMVMEGVFMLEIWMGLRKLNWIRRQFNVVLNKVAQKIKDKIVELESVVIGNEVQLSN